MMRRTMQKGMRPKYYLTTKIMQHEFPNWGACARIGDRDYIMVFNMMTDDGFLDYKEDMTWTEKKEQSVCI